MPETSQKLFWYPRGTGGTVNGGPAGGTVFLKSAFLVFLVIFLQTWAEIDARNLPKIVLIPKVDRGDSKRGTSRGASFLKICILGNLPKIFLTPRGASTLCTGMEILTWFLVGGKYYSHTWFLYATGLLRYQGPPEKLKKAKFFFKGHRQGHSYTYWNFIIFLP